MADREKNTTEPHTFLKYLDRSLSLSLCLVVCGTEEANFPPISICDSYVTLGQGTSSMSGSLKPANLLIHIETLKIGERVAMFGV